MSRSRKKPNPRRSSRPFQACPRHGYCSWCDRNRQHQALSAEERTDRDLHDYQMELGWNDNGDGVR